MTDAPMAEASASLIPLRYTDDGRILARPNSLGELYRFAQGLSRSGLIPDALRGKPDDVMVIMLTSLELGVPLMAGLRQIAVIHGKPFVEAALMQAICLQRPTVCEYVRPVAVGDGGAIWEGKRAGWPEPYQAEFGPAQAERMGLAGKDNYKRNPADMYSARACARVCRRLFPDLVGGIYVQGEVIDVEPVTSNAEVVAQKVADALDSGNGRPAADTAPEPGPGQPRGGPGEGGRGVLDGIPVPEEV